MQPDCGFVSGDIGFYSGAKKLEAALLHSEIDCTVELIPGISSVVYFAAKLGVSWDDAKIVSLMEMKRCLYRR